MARFPKKTSVSILETIPDELLKEILSRVAASSLADLSSLRLSCKMLNELAEDSFVYRKACLNKFPILEWTPLNEKQQKFLRKCRESGNPELLYREAVIDYFDNTDVLSAGIKLDKALKSGHVGALYVTCIVLLFSGDDEMKRRGIKLIGDLKKSEKKWRFYRKKLTDELKQMWVKNPVLKEGPKFCTRHTPRNQWTDEEEIQWAKEEECEACGADREVCFISCHYNYY